MKRTQLPLGVGVLVVIVALRSALRHTAWGAAKATVWVAAVTVLTCLVVHTARTAQRLSAAPLEESERAVYGVAFVGLILVALALSLPAVLTK